MDDDRVDAVISHLEGVNTTLKSLRSQGGDLEPFLGSDEVALSCPAPQSMTCPTTNHLFCWNFICTSHLLYSGTIALVVLLAQAWQMCHLHPSLLLCPGHADCCQSSLTATWSDRYQVRRRPPSSSSASCSSTIVCLFTILLILMPLNSLTR